MSYMLMRVKNFFRREDGVTAIEYGLIAALIAVAIIVAVRATGVSLSGIFTQITTALNSV